MCLTNRIVVVNINRQSLPSKEQAMTTRKSIREQADATANLIREFCLEQRALWCQVPERALLSDGRHGWNDQLRLAYIAMLWRPLDNSNSPLWYRDVSFRLAVDLASGRLVELVGAYNRGSSASEDNILRLASCLDSIDAKRVLARLKCTVKSAVASYLGPHAKEARQRNIESHHPRIEEFLRRTQAK